MLPQPVTHDDEVYFRGGLDLVVVVEPGLVSPTTTTGGPVTLED